MYHSCSLCSGWRNFDCLIASRGPPAAAELLAGISIYGINRLQELETEPVPCTRMLIVELCALSERDDSSVWGYGLEKRNIRWRPGPRPQQNGQFQGGGISGPTVKK